MAELIVNLPAQRVWIRKEYLRDLQDGHGEFVEGIWVCAKSLEGRAFYFETYLPQYAALYDKLPISAFVAQPSTPQPDLDLTNLQFWNCMGTGLRCIVKQHISTMNYEVLTRNHGKMTAKYLFTLDNYHANPDITDTNVSEIPEEHKSHNCLLLDNGQYCLYPNNRMRVYDLSLTPQTVLTPDFKVSTRVYEVESTARWGRLGQTNDYFWKTPQETT